MNVAKLLDRLAGVRSTGPGRWLARCPAHEDHSPSLSIRELGDGRILLHDFAGCGASDVLDALGLEMQDLFPDRLPERPGGYLATRSRVPAADILQAMAHEVTVAALIVGDIVNNRAVKPDEFERLQLCANRLGGAAAHGRS